MSTEKTIIYPPIFVMESHADRILSSRASEKGRNCLGSACSSTTAKGFRGRYHLRNKKEQHSAARIGKSRQICAISGCLRLCTATYPVRNAGLTLLQKESRYSPSAEEIFPLSVRSEQDFAPTGKPQRNPQTTEKEAFSEMPRKGFRIGERVWLIREMLSVRIIRPVIREKERAPEAPAYTRAAVRLRHLLATVSGEKSIRRKIRSEKTQTVFLFSSCIPAVFFCNSL